MSGPLVALRARTPLGWLQLRHNKARLAAALAGVAFADILIFMQLGFLGALTAASIASNVDWNADIVLASSEMETLDIAGTLPRRRLYQALAVEGVAEASPVYVGSLSWSDPETGDEVQTRAFGIDPAFPAFLDRDIQDRQAGLALPDTALFDRLSRGNFERLVAEVDAGRPVVLEANGRRLTLTGLFGQGATFTADGTLVVSDQTFLRFFPKRAAGAPSLIFVKVASGADATRVAARLRAVLPAKDTAVRTRAETIAIGKAYQLGKRPVGFVFSFGVVIGVIVGLVIVYQVLSTDVQDHLDEYATLKAMGYRGRYFLGVVFEEASILAGFGFVPGLSIALVLYALAARVTALPVDMPPLRALAVFLLTLAMCAASGALATRRLNRADPADLF